MSRAGCGAWASSPRCRSRGLSPATMSKSPVSCSSSIHKLRVAVTTTVVKLGSGIVAHDDGSLRGDVLAAICDDIAAHHGAGDDIVVVTSGAIARGLGMMRFASRPTAVEDL